MKKAFFLLFFLSATSLLPAQSFHVFSTPVQQEENIGFPVLVMKNGNTVFQVDDKETRSVFVNVFDKDHNLVIKKKRLGFKAVKLDEMFAANDFNCVTNIAFWLEQENNIVIYMEAKLEPYKITLDPVTFDITGEYPLQDVDIAEHTVSSKTQDHVYVRRNMVDPSTGNRVRVHCELPELSKKEIAARDNLSGIGKMSIEIYDPQEKQRNKIAYDFGGKYDYARPIYTLFSNNAVYTIIQEFKITSPEIYKAASSQPRYMYQNDLDGAITFLKIDLKTGDITRRELFRLNNTDRYDAANIVHNMDNSVFDLYFFTYTSSADPAAAVNYNLLFVPVNVQTAEIGKVFPLPFDKATEFAVKNIDPESRASGAMYNCIVDRRGNLFAASFSSISAFSNYSLNSVMTINPEKLKMENFDKNGKEISGVVYPYENAGCVNNRSINDGPGNFWKMDFTPVLVSGSKNNFIFLNDLQQNVDAPLNSKREYAKTPEFCDAVALEITATGIKPYYVFTEPGIDKEHKKYIDYFHAYYDEKTNTLIARAYEGLKFKNSMAVWIKLD